MLAFCSVTCFAMLASLPLLALFTMACRPAHARVCVELYLRGCACVRRLRVRSTRVAPGEARDTVHLYFPNVVPRGLEPRTLRLLAVRSNQLSYETLRWHSKMVPPALNSIAADAGKRECPSKHTGHVDGQRRVAALGQGGWGGGIVES